MSFPFRRTRNKKTIDPEGRRLIGLTVESGEPIFAPGGHSMLQSANGGGKTTRGCMPWLFSLISGTRNKATLVLDGKDGEMAVQMVPMLAELGVKVAVIDDMTVRPELDAWRVALNAFGALVSTYQRDARDTIFADENITHAIIEEPNNDAKNKYFRAWPRKLISFANNTMLTRAAENTTPGSISVILNDPDMLESFAAIEAEEGEGQAKAQAKAILGMRPHEHWPQHLEEAQRALELFSEGTRLHEAGRGASATHESLIRDKTVVFLVGPQAYMPRLGTYYALHILAFTDALYHGAGGLEVVADEITNCPVKPLISQITTLRAFGGAIHSVAQSRSEFIRKFGEQETRTLEENAIVKQWFGFSSFEEAERISKAIGEQHMVSEGLSGFESDLNFQTSLNLGKQRNLSPAELMAMPPELQLVHIKGVGFFLARTIGQNQIAPYCDLVADNPLEGGRLVSNPILTLAQPTVSP